ncbi:hypothetical protein PG993_002016 [Apiospora rasikravindrae]|uniref:Uncharacterized protein n=1 Tax=Apiospora rasikravindrae TaxID=990691 RepID=A0ABR1UD20_9PEZI
MYTGEPWLNLMVLSPGWVLTELGDVGADALNVDAETEAKLMIWVEESCDGIFKLLEETIKETHGGKLLLYFGETTPWYLGRRG